MHRMLFALDEYFKEYPSRIKLVEIMYRQGIALRDGRFFCGDFELPLSEVARASGVNRRTVYETIRFIESNPVLSKMIYSFRPTLDKGPVSALIGNQIISLYPRHGMFSATIPIVFGILANYMSHVQDICARNCNKDEHYLRVIVDRPLPEGVIEQLKEIPSVKRFEITTPDLATEEVVCNMCEVDNCPSKSLTAIEEL